MKKIVQVLILIIVETGWWYEGSFYHSLYFLYVEISHNAKLTITKWNGKGQEDRQGEDGVQRCSLPPESVVHISPQEWKKKAARSPMNGAGAQI